MLLEPNGTICPSPLRRQGPISQTPRQEPWPLPDLPALEQAAAQAEAALDAARRSAARRASDEGREGIAAFLEKRKPAWQGR